MDTKHRLLGSAVLALALIAGVITVLAQRSPAAAVPSQESAHVRVIHASPDAPAVDVLVDGSKVVTGTAFGQITDYTLITTGTHTVALEPSSGGSALITRSLMLTATDYTLAAVGTLDPSGKDFELRTLVDDNSAPPPRMVRARFVHFVPDAPLPVTIAIKGEAPLFEGVDYGDVTDYVTVSSGSYTLQVLVLGAEVTTGTVTLVPNSVYSFFAVGQALGTPELDLLQVLDMSYNHPLWLPLALRGG